jgi:hypothetical protein
MANMQGRKSPLLERIQGCTSVSTGECRLTEIRLKEKSTGEKSITNDNSWTQLRTIRT